ncbi:MAG: LysM peptidoglycan-binding domain-containing protein [Verrucomicrobia bacterium]|nr:MAG: LysM peptidoglycan-binding domain-containing protein [Verrucomicrobiota bacterium]
MKPLLFLTVCSLAGFFTACSPYRSDAYDTQPPASHSASASPDAAVNPVYDSAPAYEDNSASAYVAPASPSVSSPAVQAPAAPDFRSATIHTVVAGDTLSGIAAKYKVPAASIKKANNMTRDIVVLGKKMVIPPQ